MSESHIGPYEIRSKIAQTEGHTVYRAFDPRSHREVAIKLFHRPQIYTSSEKQRLKTEFERLRTRAHPAILPLLDHGVEDSRPYIVLPWMAGGTLQDRLQSNPLSLDEAVEIFNPIATALDAVADQGLIHADLKPGNILFDEQGGPVVAELGVAQALQSISTERFAPTNPAYASPEQVRGLPLDARSQVYSLGAILYHALTGQPPFQGASDDLTLFKHISDVPRRPRELRPDLPVETESTLLKALAKHPEDRFPTALAFVQELSAPAVPPQTGASIPSPREPSGVTTPERFPQKRTEDETPPTPKKRGRVLVLIGLVLLAICGLSQIASYLNNREARKQATTTAESRRTATALAGVRATATAQAMEALYQSFAQWPLVISDNFDSNRNGWSTGYSKDELANTFQKFHEGRYRWEATAHRGFVGREALKEIQASDLFLTVEARRVSGPLTGEVGLVFREDDSGNYYFFHINDNQNFSIDIRYNGQWDNLLPPTYSSTIHQPGQVNRLTVIVEGSRLAFFINGRFVGEVEDSRLNSGRTGMAIKLYLANDEGIFDFDNFELRSP